MHHPLRRLPPISYQDCARGQRKCVVFAPTKEIAHNQCILYPRVALLSYAGQSESDFSYRKRKDAQIPISSHKPKTGFPANTSGHVIHYTKRYVPNYTEIGVNFRTLRWPRNAENDDFAAENSRFPLKAAVTAGLIFESLGKKIPARNLRS